MGYADRDYIRETSTRPPSRLAGAPVVKWLLFLNLGIFLINIIFEAGMESWGAFTVPGVFETWQVWRVITFQFLHADFGHLIFNSIAIYFFGAFVEKQLKSRAFLVFYLLCGIAGAMTYTGLVLIGYESSSVVGASAGIFGILVVAAMIAPNMQVRLLLPPVTLTMKQLALILLFIGAFVVVTGGRNAGGQAGHLGGALAGFLMYRIPLLRA
ncbi:MAG: rhomboid family intramembrane serine protease, partial [Roseibacillus sp.]